MIDQLNKLNDPSTHLQESLRNKKMMLPTPQVSDQELENIASLSASGAATPAADDMTTPFGSATPSTPYHALAARTSLRTPARPAITPDSFSTATLTPSSTAPPTPIRTPAPLTPSSSKGAMQTPSRGSGGRTPSTPSRTPSGSMTPARTPLSAAVDHKRKKIKVSLSQLPSPQNEYQIVMPSLPTVSEAQDQDKLIEDAADADARRERELQALRDKEFQSRSEALKRDCPRPRVVNLTFPTSVPKLLSTSQERNDTIELLIRKEMCALLLHDAVKFPVKNAKVKAPSQPLEEFTEDDISEVSSFSLYVLAYLSREQERDFSVSVWVFLCASSAHPIPIYVFETYRPYRQSYFLKRKWNL